MSSTLEEDVAAEYGRRRSVSPQKRHTASSRRFAGRGALDARGGALDALSGALDAFGGALVAFAFWSSPAASGDALAQQIARHPAHLVQLSQLSLQLGLHGAKKVQGLLLWAWELRLHLG